MAYKMDCHILYFNTISFVLFTNIYLTTLGAQDDFLTFHVQGDPPEGSETFNVDHRQNENGRPHHITEENVRQPRRKILVTTVLQPPYMMIKKQSIFLTGNDRYEGMLADVLWMIADRAGFDYEIRLSRDGLHGNEGENGTWSGMIGEIYRDEAQLAVGALQITSKRRQVVQFTDPIMTFQSSAILKRPRHHRKHERVPRSRPRIRTLEDLHNTDIQYGVVSGSLTASIIKESTDPLLNAMWIKMTTSWPSPFVYNVQEGVQRAAHENYAFITDSPLAEYVTTRKPCHLYKTGNFLDRQHYAFAVRHSTNEHWLRDSINEQIRHLRSNGELEALRNRWWASECDNKRETKDTRSDDVLSKPTVRPFRFATAKVYQSTNKAAQDFNMNLIHLLVISVVMNLFSYS